MIEPAFYNIKEIEKIGISEREIRSAAHILNGAMGQEWIKQQEKISKKYEDGSISKALNRHPVHKLLVDGTVQSVIKLVELTKCLELFSQEKSIANYLQRLRSHREAKQTIFELMTAKAFSELSFKVEGLQMLNVENNPVEIVASESGVQFWVECKSTESLKFPENIRKKIIRKINKEIPKNIAIHLKILKELNTREEKEVIYKVIKKINEIPQMDLNNGSHKFINDLCEMQFIKYEDALADQIIELFHRISSDNTEMLATGFAPSSSSNSDAPDTKKDLEKVKKEKIIAVETAYELEKKSAKLETLVKKIRLAVKQQKCLLDNNDEVIILLDKNNFPKDLFGDGKLKQSIKVSTKHYPFFA